MASEFDISQAAAAIYAESLLQLADEQNSAEQVGQAARTHVLAETEPVGTFEARP